MSVIDINYTLETTDNDQLGLLSSFLATLLDGASYLFSQAKFQNLLKSLYGVLRVEGWKEN